MKVVIDENNLQAALNQVANIQHELLILAEHGVRPDPLAVRAQLQTVLEDLEKNRVVDHYLDGLEDDPVTNQYIKINNDES